MRTAATGLPRNLTPPGCALILPSLRDTVAARGGCAASSYNRAIAQKVVAIYTDDLTGEESSEATHTFSLDGVQYEIDLAPDSYDQLLEAMAPFTKAGRKTGRTRKSHKVTAVSCDDSAAIRVWAKEAGYDVSNRGRVPAEVREAYAKAH
ncbi:hypothetical protein GCM10010211_80880 [Streptomyces albospinus]|uniref:Lsr2 family protein n=1 Tax=Streptomyces albospinus TaxID=285515 RepID=A0ABQ2VQ07_9ACTN|nr:Lsr2 family protein [Streptomyces albospinus]GGV01418.1 hypothetical protein GCM10010211_80880 [Streptomyces albospinus]